MSVRPQTSSPILPKRQPQVVLAKSEHTQGFGPGPSNVVPNPSELDFLFSNDVITYKCSCDLYQRLSSTYFCRHCIALRCKSCVAREVDSQYCQHCLEYIPTIDPNFQKNKCATCYLCPCCQHLLSSSILPVSPQAAEQAQQLHQQQQEQSTLSGQQQSQAPQEDVIQRKCQLVCEFCRWSSEKFTTVGSKQAVSPFEFKDPNADKINQLISFYKVTSRKERAEKKKRRFQKRSGNTMDLLKKYGIDNTLSPKLFESLRARTTLNDKSVSTNKFHLESKSDEDSVIEAFKPEDALSVDQLDPLDKSFYYNKDFDLGSMSSIEQRLAHVELQPERTTQFKPISKFLSVKNSLRCKRCERNLCRSEYSPVSIRFKIQSSALYHVPELRLKTDVYPIKLKLDVDNIVEMTVQNQTLFPVKVKVNRLMDDQDNTDLHKESQHLAYQISLPPSELSLGPKDDTTDYEHVPFTLRPLNEETQITFQSPFKIGFFVKVRPLVRTENLMIKFSLTHDIQILQNSKEAEKEISASHTVGIQLGPVE